MKKKAKTRKKSKSQNAAFEYEGYPHYLRRPSGLDFDTLAPSFPFQPVLTHTFEFMRRDGTPDPDYNAGLIDFDTPVTGYGFKSKSMLADLRKRVPGLELSVAMSKDAKWSFIRKYTMENLS